MALPWNSKLFQKNRKGTDPENNLTEILFLRNKNRKKHNISHDDKHIYNTKINNPHNPNSLAYQDLPDPYDNQYNKNYDSRKVLPDGKNKIGVTDPKSDNKSLTNIPPKRVIQQVHNMEEIHNNPYAKKLSKNPKYNQLESEMKPNLRDKESHSIEAGMCCAIPNNVSYKVKCYGKDLPDQRNVFPSVILKRKGLPAKEYQVDQMECALKNIKCPMVIKFHSPIRDSKEWEEGPTKELIKNFKKDKYTTGKPTGEITAKIKTRKKPEEETFEEKKIKKVNEVVRRFRDLESQVNDCINEIKRKSSMIPSSSLKRDEMSPEYLERQKALRRLERPSIDDLRDLPSQYIKYRTSPDQGHVTDEFQQLLPQHSKVRHRTAKPPRQVLPTDEFRQLSLKHPKDLRRVKYNERVLKTLQETLKRMRNLKNLANDCFNELERKPSLKLDDLLRDKDGKVMKVTPEYLQKLKAHIAKQKQVKGKNLNRLNELLKYIEDLEDKVKHYMNKIERKSLVDFENLARDKTHKIPPDQLQAIQPPGKRPVAGDFEYLEPTTSKKPGRTIPPPEDIFITDEFGQLVSPTTKQPHRIIQPPDEHLPTDEFGRVIRPYSKDQYSIYQPPKEESPIIDEFGKLKPPTEHRFTPPAERRPTTDELGQLQPPSPLRIIPPAERRPTTDEIEGIPTTEEYERLSESYVDRDKTYDDLSLVEIEGMLKHIGSIEYDVKDLISELKKDSIISDDLKRWEGDKLQTVDHYEELPTETIETFISDEDELRQLEKLDKKSSWETISSVTKEDKPEVDEIHRPGDRIVVPDVLSEKPVKTTAEAVTQDTDFQQFSAFVIDISLSLDGDEVNDDSNLYSESQDFGTADNQMKHNEQNFDESSISEQDRLNTGPRFSQNDDDKSSPLNQNYNKTVYLATDIKPNFGFLRNNSRYDDKKKDPLRKSSKYKKSTPSAKTLAAMKTKPEKEDYLECNRIFMVNYLTQTKKKLDINTDSKIINEVLPQIYDKLSDTERIQFLNIINDLIFKKEISYKDQKTTSLKENMGLGDHINSMFQLRNNETQNYSKPKYLLNRSKFSIQTKRSHNKRQQKFSKSFEKILVDKKSVEVDVGNNNVNTIDMKMSKNAIEKQITNCLQIKKSNPYFGKTKLERSYSKQLKPPCNKSNFNNIFKKDKLNEIVINSYRDKAYDSNCRSNHNCKYTISNTNKQLSNQEYKQLLHKRSIKLKKNSAEENTSCCDTAEVKLTKSNFFNHLGEYKRVKPNRKTSNTLERCFDIENVSEMKNKNKRIKVEGNNYKKYNNEGQVKLKSNEEIIHAPNKLYYNTEDSLSEITNNKPSMPIFNCSEAEKNLLSKEIKEQLLPVMKELNGTLRDISYNLKQCVSSTDLSIEEKDLLDNRNKLLNFKKDNSDLIEINKSMTGKYINDGSNEYLSQDEINTNQKQKGNHDCNSKQSCKITARNELQGEEQYRNQICLLKPTDPIKDTNNDIVINCELHKHKNSFENTSLENSFAKQKNIEPKRQNTQISMINNKLDMTKMNLQTEDKKIPLLYKVILSNPITFIIDNDKFTIDDAKCSTQLNPSPDQNVEKKCASYSSHTDVLGTSNINGNIKAEELFQNDSKVVGNLEKRVVLYKNKIKTSRFRKLMTRVLPFCFKVKVNE